MTKEQAKAVSAIRRRIGAELKQAAKRKGKTLYKMAGETGLAPSSISTAFNGRNVELDSLLKLAIALDCTIEVQQKAAA